jgi:hypothetical protein
MGHIPARRKGWRITELGKRASATVPVRFPASTLVGIGTISHAEPVHE